VWLARRTTAAPGPASPPMLRRLTTRVGANASPAISPDGSAVAYASDRTGALEIYVVGLAPGSHETAVTNDGGQNLQPEWSPDGQFVVFAVSQGGWRNEIWIVPASGGGAHRLAMTDGATDPRFSLDGQSIYWGGATAQGNGRLWRMSIDARTGEARGAPEGA